MAILVTGGTGFIGSHTILELVKSNFDVIVIDSLVNSSERVLHKIEEILKSEKIYNPKKIKFFHCDVRDELRMRKIFQIQKEIKKPIDSVIHFAGLKSIRESFEKPFLYWDNNVGGTIKLIKIMKEFNCQNLVFSSSATVYDAQAGQILNEETTLKPINPYGETKLAIENFLKSISKNDSKNLSIACLRYFNPIGAHPSGLIGESPLGIPNNVFPLICQVASGKLEKFEIFGNNWPTHDGTGVRDYIHVLDLAKAHEKAIRYIRKNKPGCIFLNVGTALGTSVLELITTFERVNNCSINYIFTNRRYGDHAQVVADNKLFTEIFDWSPQYSLEEMCRHGWKWQINNPLGYK